MHILRYASRNFNFVERFSCVILFFSFPFTVRVKLLTTWAIEFDLKNRITHSARIITHGDLYTERYHLSCWIHKKSLFEATVPTAPSRATGLQDVFYYGLAFRSCYKSSTYPPLRSETCIISRITNLFLRWLGIESSVERTLPPHHSWSTTVYSVLKRETILGTVVNDALLLHYTQLKQNCRDISLLISVICKYVNVSCISSIWAWNTHAINVSD